MVSKFNVGDAVCWRDTAEAKDYKRLNSCPDQFVISHIVDHTTFPYVVWQGGESIGAMPSHLELAEGPW